MTETPKTLGEKLAIAPQTTTPKVGKWMRSFVHNLVKFILLCGIVGLPMWWLLAMPDIGGYTVLALIVAMYALRVWVIRLSSPSKRPTTKLTGSSLIANDRIGFMADLRLEEKTAVFDGSNIYHFGHDHDVDVKPLEMLVNQLRSEGYRIVCFFDANIFYTLKDHGALGEDQRHSTAVLKKTFGLKANEIYVVPSGVQADQYVLNTLKHLPNSFAVTNDKFRDYAKPFAKVMKGQWRKGVKLSKGEIKLLQHKLEQPLRVH